MTAVKTLVLAAVAAQTGCATMTGTFELAGVRWSDGGRWKEVTPIRPEAAPVGAVLVEPQVPRVTCFRTPEAHITTFTARYTTMYKVLAGFMFVSEGLIATLLLASDNSGTGGRVAGAIVGADALATLGLMLFTHQKIAKEEDLPPQFTVVATCPADTGVFLGERFVGVDEHGSFRVDDKAALANDLVADVPRNVRVGGRTVPVPLTEAERADKRPVLVVLERPSYVVPWPVEPPVIRVVPGGSAVATGGVP